MSDISYIAAPSRPRTSGFYIALVLVGAFFVITPLSWTFLAVAVWNGFPKAMVSGVPSIIFVWSILEALFYIYQKYLTQYVIADRESMDVDPEHLRVVFMRVLQSGLSPDDSTAAYDGPPEAFETLDADDPRAVDFRNRIRTWFRKAPWSAITRQAMLSWISWLSYDVALPAALEDPVRNEFLHDSLALVEKRSGTTLPERPADGHKEVVPLRLTMDPLGIWTRPLALYLFCSMTHHAVMYWSQWRWGFTKGEYQGLEYLLRIPPDWTPTNGWTDPTSAPVVFVHGLGIGLLQYFATLERFTVALSSHPLLVLVQPHISQDIWHPRHLHPPARAETVKALGGLIRELGFGPSDEGSGKDEGGVIFISHSNGSVAHTWMLKDCPELLQRSCFVDPITLCLWEGDVCYNFVYRAPATCLELLMWYFVGSELGTANLLQRHFVWSSNVLWFDDLKSPCDRHKTLFMLGGRDAIVDADRVRAYLLAHGVSDGLIFNADAAHGFVILRNGPGLEQVVDWVKGIPPSIAAEHRNGIGNGGDVPQQAKEQMTLRSRTRIADRSQM